MKKSLIGNTLIIEQGIKTTMKNKKLKKALLAAFGLAAVAGYLETTGYNVLNREDGTNPLCDIDPACRYLTDGETEKSKDIFGGEVEYSSVKVFNRPNYVVYPLSRLFSFRSNKQSFYGNIYYNKTNDYEDDLSKYSFKMKYLIHEMTHVWQYQSGVNMLFAAASIYKDAKSNYSKGYAYNIHDDKSFDEHNIEQQGEMVAQYYSYYDSIGRTGDLKTWQKGNCTPAKQHAVKISPVLPIKKIEGC